MRTRPPYSPVKLFYDGRKVEVGEYLKSNGGSMYLIQGVTPSPSKPQRRYLACLRWPPNEVPADAVVHPIFWYARKKRRASLSDIAARSS